MWTSPSSYDSVVSSWVSETKGKHLDVGLSVSQAQLKAAELLKSLQASTLVFFSVDADAIDVLYATCRLFESASPDPAIVEAMYKFVASLDWTDDLFAEREQLLADLAYLAWNANRQHGRYTSMARWQRLCLSHVELQDTSRDFLALGCDHWSLSLCQRFLRSHSLLLAASTALQKGRNRKPKETLRGSIAVYEWLSLMLKDGASEELVFFAGDVAYNAACCFRHLGKFRAHGVWLSLASELFKQTSLPGPYLSRIVWSGLVSLYDRHQFGVVGAIPRITTAFRNYGMTEDQLRSIFFEAHALKSVGRFVDSRSKFETARRCAAIAGDDVMVGSSLVGVAECTAQLGEPELALRLLGVAAGLLNQAGVPMGIAGLHAAVGEVLRNEGNLDDAVSEYQKAMATYHAGGFSFQVAYVRLILADTLIAAGRGGEAIRVLAEAFPVIEQEGAEVDAVAAVALLREAMRRQVGNSRLPSWLMDSLGLLRAEPDA